MFKSNFQEELFSWESLTQTHEARVKVLNEEEQIFGVLFNPPTHGYSMEEDIPKARRDAERSWVSQVEDFVDKTFSGASVEGK